MSEHHTSAIKRPARQATAATTRPSRLADLTRPITQSRRIAQQRRTVLLLSLGALIVAGAIGAALFVLPAQTWFRQDDVLTQRQAQLDQLEQVNADLQAEVDRLGTDDGIREAAREEIGYIEPGEARESVLALPALAPTLPVGWPYDLVTGIIHVRSSATP